MWLPLDLVSLECSFRDEQQQLSRGSKHNNNAVSLHSSSNTLCDEAEFEQQDDDRNQPAPKHRDYKYDKDRKKRARANVGTGAQWEPATESPQPPKTPTGRRVSFSENVLLAHIESTTSSEDENENENEFREAQEVPQDPESGRQHNDVVVVPLLVAEPPCLDEPPDGESERAHVPNRSESKCGEVTEIGSEYYYRDHDNDQRLVRNEGEEHVFEDEEPYAPEYHNEVAVPEVERQRYHDTTSCHPNLPPLQSVPEEEDAGVGSKRNGDKQDHGTLINRSLIMKVVNIGECSYPDSM